MKIDSIINDDLVFGGFTAGNSGIWTRNKADDPASEDYLALSRQLDIPTEKMVRPYQINGEKAAIVDEKHGGCGVIKEDPLTQTDGLVTDVRGVMLSIIAADCVPVYLTEPFAGVIGLLHCGRQAAAGKLLHNAVEKMNELGAVTDRINVVIGHHICEKCYEVGDDVRADFSESFSADELEMIFSSYGGKYHLDLAKALVLKAEQEGISAGKIRLSGECTCCSNSYYSYRRGDRGKQNLAFLMMKNR